MNSQFDAFSETAKKSIILAQSEMEKLKHSQIQSQHLLLGILQQPQCTGSMVLQRFGISYENAWLIAKEMNLSPLEVPETLITHEKKQPTPQNSLSDQKLLSVMSQKTIEKAAKIALEAGHHVVDSEHLLYALLSQKKSSVMDILEALKIRPSQVLEHLNQIFQNKNMQGSAERGNIAAPPPQIESFLNNLGGVLSGMFNQGGENIEGVEKPQDPSTQNKSRKQKMALDYFCTDFTEKAQEGSLEPVIGRKKEIDRCIQILCRKTKNNPVLLGEPGVGKTAIAEGLAHKIVQGQVPNALLDKRILFLAMSDLVAGTKYRGEFEERIKRIIEEASDQANEVVLFIDELHTIIGAGGAEGTLDAANILKPALSRGVIQIIGATTFDEYQKYIEKDVALARRFQSVTVPEPSVSEAIEILQGIKPHYENFHGVVITQKAIESAVKLSERYVADRFLPDKAFDLLDEACAACSVSNRKNGKSIRDLRLKISAIVKKKEAAVLSQNYQKANELHEKERNLEKEILKLKKSKISLTEMPKIEPPMVAKVLEQITGIPSSTLLASDLESLKNLEKTLSKNLIGQNDAISQVSNAIRKARVGLQNPNRPLGVFMFLGPTGVGKTELVKQLAQEVYHDKDALVKIDMSEFSASHTASRLVGATAGYIGHDKGGDLTEKIRKNPHSIILFDEIEKAHKEVHNMLLQIFEDGVLTDGKGRKVNFKNTIIILTSNIGAQRFQNEANSIGFSDSVQDLTLHEADFDRAQESVKKDLKKQFSLEFVNRMDGVIVFRPLNRDGIKKILQLEIKKLETRLESKNIKLKIGGATINSLAKQSYNPAFGAREIRRVIAEKLEKPIVEYIIETGISNDVVLKLTYNQKLKSAVIEKV